MNYKIIIIFSVFFTLISCDSILNYIIYKDNPEELKRANDRDAEQRRLAKRKEQLQNLEDSEDATDAMLKRSCLNLDSLDAVEKCLKDIGIHKSN